MPGRWWIADEPVRSCMWLAVSVHSCSLSRRTSSSVTRIASDSWAWHDVMELASQVAGGNWQGNCIHRACLPRFFFIISIFVDRGPPMHRKGPAGFFLACVSRPAVVFASVNLITVLIQLTVRFMVISKFIFKKNKILYN